MKPDDIKLGMVLWSICDGKPYLEGEVTGVNERFLADGIQVFFDTGDYSFSDRLYPSKEAAQRVVDLARTPWRTDFENMPKDGSIFWSVVSGFVETIWFEDGCFKYHAMGRYIVVTDEEILCWMPIPDYSMFLEDEAEAGERKVVYGGRLAGGMSIGLSGLDSAAEKAKRERGE